MHSENKPVIPKPMCTIAPERTSSEYRSDESVSDSESVPAEVNSHGNGNFGMELISSEFYFKPIYSLGAWQKPDDNDNRYISVAILLFTGQDTTLSYNLAVVGGGNILEYSVTWPPPFEIPRLLHRKWLEVENSTRIMHYHPMVTCFNQFIRRIRGDRERIRTTSRLPLPFPVETDIDEHLLKFPGTAARVLYGIIRAPAEKTRNLEERELVFE